MILRKRMVLSEREKLKVVFLGTNGWFDTETGNTVCALIKAGTCNIVFDAGNGIYKLDKYFDKKKSTYIFLSHLHIDHIEGLHSLAKFSFPAGLRIYAPKGMIFPLKRFLEHPYTVPPRMLPFSLEIHNAEPELSLSGVKISSRELVHSSKCLGYRFEDAGKVVSYCTDTGMCANALKLAHNADLLITECALKKGQQDKGWPHLNPLDAATMAKNSGAKKLVLTHFDAHNYKTFEERNVAQRDAKKIFAPCLAARDGLQLTI